MREKLVAERNSVHLNFLISKRHQTAGVGNSVDGHLHPRARRNQLHIVTHTTSTETSGGDAGVL
jgi:hypothetical protein